MASWLWLLLLWLVGEVNSGTHTTITLVEMNGHQDHVCTSEIVNIYHLVFVSEQDFTMGVVNFDELASGVSDDLLASLL